MTDTRTDNDEEPEIDSPSEPGAGPPWMRRRRHPLVRRVGGRVGGHVETRASYGVLTLCTFGFTAGALLVVIAVVGAIVYLAQGRLLHALAFLVGGLLFAAIAAALGFGAGFIGLPFAGDWFLEWPSHAIAWALGLAGCALLASLVLLTPLPPYLGVLLTVAAVFGAGYTVAYALRTTKPMAARQGRAHRQTGTRRRKR
jgi:hypothetical protein